MDMLFTVFLSAFLASIAWFIVGGIVYMNPFVAKIYRKYKDHPCMKKWSSQRSYLLGVYLIAGLVPILAASFIYYYIAPVGIFYLTLLLVGLHIVPRMCDMYVQTSYPNKLLFVELVNGVVLSFVVACVFHWGLN